MADQSAILNSNRLGIFATSAIRLVTSTGTLNSRVVSTSYVVSNNVVTNILAGRLRQAELDIYALSTAGVGAIQIQAAWGNSLSTATFGPQMNTTQSSAVYVARTETIHIPSSAFSTTGTKYALPVQGDKLRLNVRTVSARGRIRIDGQFWG